MKIPKITLDTADILKNRRNRKKNEDQGDDIRMKQFRHAYNQGQKTRYDQPLEEMQGQPLFDAEAKNENDEVLYNFDNDDVRQNMLESSSVPETDYDQ